MVNGPLYGFSMGLANNKLQLIRSTTAARNCEWQKANRGVGEACRGRCKLVCLWTSINAFKAFMQMAGNNLSPIQDATTTAAATIAIAIAAVATKTTTITTTIKPSIHALQYAKVLIISVTPTQFSLSGRGHNPHTFSRCFCFSLRFSFFYSGFFWRRLCLICFASAVELILLLLHFI